MNSLTISDPRQPQVPRWLAILARPLLNDVRDSPFLPRIIVSSLALYGGSILLFLPGAFSWPLAGFYLFLNLGVLTPPFILMLHNTSHRQMFKRRFGWMNQVIPWVLGPMLGQSPFTYFSHHIGMHHPENNLEEDLSSTMKYQRDSALAFSHYFLTFFFKGGIQLTSYLLKHGRTKLAHRVILGEALFIGAVAALLTLNWQATLAVLVIPFIFCRLAMMMGNWGQHAFIDPESPENCYRNSITCINSFYNRRCYNDGYHIGHHLKSGLHWSDMPQDFEAHQEEYVAERAFVFEGLDYFLVWLFLMLKRYDWLASRLVQLGSTPVSQTQRILDLRARTTPILGN